MKQPLKEKGIETLRRQVNSKWFYLAENKQLCQTKRDNFTKINIDNNIQTQIRWTKNISKSRDKLHAKATVISPVPTDTKV